MDIKLIFACVAVALDVVGYTPYFRDIFKLKTTPHMYTWLIWFLTQGTASFAVLYGGGRFAALSGFTGTFLVFIIFLLSFKYGTKNIRKIDTAVLVFALLAIVVWWQLHSPLVAVIIVCAIDGLGYIPTWRKTYEEPWSETWFFWLVMAIISALTIAASAQYNLLTVLYPAVLFVANALVCMISLIRRRTIPRPVLD